MLDIAESRRLTPAGRSRRTFMRIGSLCVGGLSCADLLRLNEASAATTRPSQKSVIMIYLPGGASHIDMYDMKPEAPVEYRGEFRPIQTNVAGLDVCELLPLHAKIADKFSIIRGIKTQGNHDPTELLTGIPAAGSGQIGPNRRPAIGCVVSKLRGADGPIPPYVSVATHKLLPSYDDPEEPAYLGPLHRPFNIAGDVRRNLEISKEISARFEGRRELLRSLDRAGNDLPGMTTYNARALEMLTTTKVREALDLSRETVMVREAYGEGFDPRAESQGLDLLRARRLAEAGVSLVSVGSKFIGKPAGTVFDPGWDTHAANFGLLRNKLPLYDRAVSALINDLYDRGLSDRVAVVIWSEFGRQPKIGDVTPDGRGHWPSAMCALVAGGGLKMGQIIGDTDNRGERARSRPYGTQDVLATIYHMLGIDLRETIVDHNGRPQYLVDRGQPITGLI